MKSKLPCVVPTCHEGRFGPWFELDWTGRPNPSIAARHGKQPTVGSLQSWYQSGFPAIWFHSSAASAIVFIEEDREASMAFWGMEPRAHLQVMLASRRLIGEARIWWLSLGDPEIPINGLSMPYRGLDIYRDMYMRRYVSYIVAWSAYPNESMGHCCQRFRDAMLPYIPLDMDRPMMQALNILRYGLPPEAAPKAQATDYKDDHPLIPVYDADIRESVFHEGPFMPEEPIPALPIQEENSEDPPVIIITSDDEEEIEEK
ncbi:hypothetical protein TIFTF001_034050 [Ficus carica]|uniref:Uncharacterized protein n=1 Tax=Ficus carica TaxID=3494 RepID=A0AA88JA58_FICCA|nr:hypothetical protein TIFTF001_034050 [Ficus carica]